MNLYRPTRIIAFAFAVLLGWAFPSVALCETVLDVGADWNFLRRICFSPDGEIVAAAVDVGERKTAITLWKRSTAERIANFVVDEPHLQHLTFSPDGQRLVSSHLRFWTSNCRVWNVKEKALERQLADDKIGVVNVAFSTDGKLLVTGNADRTIKWWSVETGAVVQSVGSPVPNNGIAVSPNGKLVAADFQDGTIRVWSSAGKELHRFDVDKEGDYPSVMTFSPSSKYLTVGSREFIRSWDLTTAKAQWRKKYFERELLEAIDFLAYARDGKTLVAFGKNRLFVVAAESGRKLREAEVDAHTLALSSDWEWMVLWRSDQLILDRVPAIVRTAHNPE